MFLNQQKITPIQKTISTTSAGSSWNNSIITWTLLHTQQKTSKLYQISLQIVKLSAKREVRVNGELKISVKVSFGFQYSFQLCYKVKAKIKQNGLSFHNFQLFLNDQSFTQLQENKPKYYAIKQSTLLNLNQNNKYGGKEQKQPYTAPQKKSEQFEKVIKKDVKQKVTNQESQKMPVLTQQQKIKETQKQLMKILKASKNSNKVNAIDKQLTKIPQTI